jgi:hypothetical protein
VTKEFGAGDSSGRFHVGRGVDDAENPADKKRDRDYERA